MWSYYFGDDIDKKTPGWIMGSQPARDEIDNDCRFTHHLSMNLGWMPLCSELSHWEPLPPFGVLCATHTLHSDQMLSRNFCVNLMSSSDRVHTVDLLWKACYAMISASNPWSLAIQAYATHALDNIIASQVDVLRLTYCPVFLVTALIHYSHNLIACVLPLMI